MPRGNFKGLYKIPFGHLYRRQLHGLLSRPDQKLKSLLGPVALFVMIGQCLKVLFEGVVFDLLDSGGNPGVEYLALLEKETVVSNILGESVLKHINKFREKVFLCDQLRLLKGLKNRAQLVAGFGDFF
jgi:hypothetical protein